MMNSIYVQAKVISPATEMRGNLQRVGVKRGAWALLQIASHDEAFAPCERVSRSCLVCADEFKPAFLHHAVRLFVIE